MHILHVCNDFLGTTAHISLFKELDALGVVQTVFVPVKQNTDTTKRTIDFKTEGSSLVFSKPQKTYHKYMYGLKIQYLTKDIIRKVDLSQIDLIHTAILCNEGAIAYELHKKYGIPYISAVRNTDLNSYIKFFRWRIPYFKKIATNAEKIIFISSQYPQRLSEVFHLNESSEIVAKYKVIHNGLQNLYLDNKYYQERKIGNPISIVITGAFVQNKNIHGLIDAVKQLRENGYNIILSAIGNNLKSYAAEQEYADSIIEKEKNLSWFHTYPAQPKEQLCQSLREHDIFALFSFQETFGLSYLEALSQGLPIVYTNKEGFDGTYEEGLVGYGGDANDVGSMASALQKCIDNYSTLNHNLSNLNLEDFRWSNIAAVYKKLYESLLIK